MTWSPPAWAQTHASTSASTSTTNTLNPKPARARNPRLNAAARAFLEEYIRTTTDRPTAQQKQELLARVQAFCPGYPLRSLEIFFQHRRKVARDRAAQYERELHDSLWPSLTPEHTTKLTTIYLPHAPDPDAATLALWAQALRVPEPELAAFLAHRRTLPPARAPPPPIVTALPHLPTPSLSTSPEPRPAAFAPPTPVFSPRLPPIATFAIDDPQANAKVDSATAKLEVEVEKDPPRPLSPTSPTLPRPALRAAHALPLSPPPSAHPASAHAFSHAAAAPNPAPLPPSLSRRPAPRMPEPPPEPEPDAPPPRSLAEFCARHAPYAARGEALVHKAHSGTYRALGL